MSEKKLVDEPVIRQTFLRDGTEERRKSLDERKAEIATETRKRIQQLSTDTSTVDGIDDLARNDTSSHAVYEGRGLSERKPTSSCYEASNTPQISTVNFVSTEVTYENGSFDESRNFHSNKRKTTATRNKNGKPDTPRYISSNDTHNNQDSFEMNNHIEAVNIDDGEWVLDFTDYNFHKPTFCRPQQLLSSRVESPSKDPMEIAIISLTDHQQQVDFLNRQLDNKEDLIQNLMKTLDEESDQLRKNTSDLESLKSENKRTLSTLRDLELEANEGSVKISEMDRQINSLKEVLDSEREVKRILTNKYNLLKKSSLVEKEELKQKIEVLQHKISKQYDDIRSMKQSFHKESKCLATDKTSTISGNNIGGNSIPHHNDVMGWLETNEQLKVQKDELVHNLMDLLAENDHLRTELNNIQTENNELLAEKREEVMKLKSELDNALNQIVMKDAEMQNFQNATKGKKIPNINGSLSNNIHIISNDIGIIMQKLDNNLNGEYNKGNNNEIRRDDCNTSSDSKLNEAAQSKEQYGNVRRTVCQDEQDAPFHDAYRCQIFSETTNRIGNCTDFDTSTVKVITLDKSTDTDGLNHENKLQNEETGRLKHMLTLEQEQNDVLNQKLKESLNLYDDIYEQLDALTNQCMNFKQENKELRNELEHFVKNLKSCENTSIQKSDPLDKTDGKHHSDAESKCKIWKLSDTEEQTNTMHNDIKPHLFNNSNLSPTIIHEHANNKFDGRNKKAKRQENHPYAEQGENRKLPDDEAYITASRNSIRDNKNFPVGAWGGSSWSEDHYCKFISRSVSLIKELENKYFYKLDGKTPEDEKSNYKHLDKEVRHISNLFRKEYRTALAIFFFIFIVQITLIACNLTDVYSVAISVIIIICVVFVKKKNWEKQLLLAEQRLKTLESLNLKSTFNLTEQHTEFSELYSIIEKQEDVLEKQKMVISVLEKQVKKERRKRNDIGEKLKKGLTSMTNVSTEQQTLTKEPLKGITLSEFLLNTAKKNMSFGILAVLTTTLITLALCNYSSSALYSSFIFIFLTVIYLILNQHNKPSRHDHIIQKESFVISSIIALVLMVIFTFDSINDRGVTCAKFILGVCSTFTSYLTIMNYRKRQISEEELLEKTKAVENISSDLCDVREELERKKQILQLRTSYEKLNIVPVLKREDLDSIEILIEKLDTERKQQKQHLEDNKSMKADIIRSIDLNNQLTSQVTLNISDIKMMKDANASLRRQLFQEQVNLIELKVKLADVNKKKGDDRSEVAEVDNFPHAFGSQDHSLQRRDSLVANAGSDINDMVYDSKVVKNVQNAPSSREESDSEASGDSDSDLFKSVPSNIANEYPHKSSDANGDAKHDKIMYNEEIISTKSIPKEHITSRQLSKDSGLSSLDHSFSMYSFSNGNHKEASENTNQQLLQTEEENQKLEKEFQSILSNVLNDQKSVCNEILGLTDYYERGQQEKLALSHQVNNLQQQISKINIQGRKFNDKCGKQEKTEGKLDKLIVSNNNNKNKNKKEEVVSFQPSNKKEEVVSFQPSKETNKHKVQEEQEETNKLEEEFQILLAKVLNDQKSVSTEIIDLTEYYKRDQQEKLALSTQVTQLRKKIDIINTKRSEGQEKGDAATSNTQVSVQSACSKCNHYHSLVLCYKENIYDLEYRVGNEKRKCQKLVNDYENELDILENVLIRKYKEVNTYVKTMEECIQSENFEKFAQLKEDVRLTVNSR